MVFASNGQPIELEGNLTAGAKAIRNCNFKHELVGAAAQVKLAKPMKVVHVRPADLPIV